MSATMRVKLDSDGIREFLMSEGVADMVKGVADEVASRANGDRFRGFDSNIAIRGKGGQSRYKPAWQGRAIGYVRTVTPEAKRLEAQEKTLERVVSSWS